MMYFLSQSMRSNIKIRNPRYFIHFPRCAYVGNNLEKSVNFEINISKGFQSILNYMWIVSHIGCSLHELHIWFTNLQDYTCSVQSLPGYIYFYACLSSLCHTEIPWHSKMLICYIISFWGFIIITALKIYDRMILFTALECTIFLLWMFHFPARRNLHQIKFVHREISVRRNLPLRNGEITGQGRTYTSTCISIPAWNKILALKWFLYNTMTKFHQQLITRLSLKYKSGPVVKIWYNDYTRHDRSTS